MTAWIDFPDSTKHSTLLPPPGRRPYYIVAPPYTRGSVGVRCLHLLIHWLNRLGYSAWLVAFGRGGNPRINPDLVSPELTQAIRDYHRSLSLTPIVVYPEIVSGNPLRAPVVARYVLNFPGLLGGDRIFPPGDLVFGFSRALAEAAGAPDNVLHLPALDTNLFSPEPAAPRQGTCHYLGKYHRDHGGVPFRLPAGSVEIPGDPKAMDQATIASIFRSSELFYVYENTALIVEACLCGCPVVMMPNQWLTASIAEQELGFDGIAWGDSAEEIGRARMTVGRMRERYQRTIEDFFPQLQRFIALTQERAALVTVVAPRRHQESRFLLMGFWLPAVIRLRRLAKRATRLTGGFDRGRNKN